MRASKSAMIQGLFRRGMLAWFFFAGATVTAVASSVEEVVNPRETLVFKDGDRVQGRVVQRTAGMIVFKSDRFGELKVKAADVVVIPAEKPVTPAPKSAAPKPAVAAAPTPKARADAAHAAAKQAAVAAEAEKVTVWDRFTPGVLTARVRKVFGPWKGRIAFSTEVVSDAAERNNHSLESRVTRKWERDQIQFNGRYLYAQTNDLATTDTLKGTASWRHEFTKSVFAQYRPSVEWNRASRRQGVPNDYVLLQQEVGIGYNVINTPARKVRTGVSENFFNIWNSAPRPDHSARIVQSVFEEVEIKLPWQMGLTQRGVWYPVKEQVDGWEHRIELNKKLTETLSTSVRHEIRRDNPDGSAQDYTRLKLLFGLDF